MQRELFYFALSVRGIRRCEIINTTNKHAYIYMYTKNNINIDQNIVVLKRVPIYARERNARHFFA